MSLKNDLFDAIIDGKIGTGLVVTRQEVIDYFSDRKVSYTGVILSNSEICTSQHSPTYRKFSIRIDEGKYRIHPQVIADRYKKRGRKY